MHQNIYTKYTPEFAALVRKIAEEKGITTRPYFKDGKGKI